MTVELVTGYAGSAHITASDDGWRNAGLVGSGMYVLETGSQVSCSVSSNTAVVIGTGDIIMQGRHIRIHAQETVSIDNGAQGVNRNDIICMHYTRDTATGIETAELAVIKGTATSGTAQDPTIPSGNILSSAASAYMPLWRIPLTGINIGTPVKLYGNILPTLETAGTGSVAASRLTGTIAAARIPNLAASKITSGTLDAARIPALAPSKISGTLDASQIPSLDASKITSGTLAAARIPSLDASKIGGGTLAAARVPSLDASKIASGTLSADRIPSLAASKIASGTLSADRIPNLSAAKITGGTLALARGGTGADGSSVAANRVFASPNGSTGAAAFRALVANDLPTVPVSKGGTGAATASANRVFAAPNGSSGAPSFRALVAADVPSLPASKIGSGQFALAHMPMYSLYTGSGNGTTGDVTLSETAANYTMLEVFYKSTTDLVCGSVRVWSPNGKRAQLTAVTVNQYGQMFLKAKVVEISGTTIKQLGYAGYFAFPANQYTSENGFYIYKVVGYK